MLEHLEIKNFALIEDLSIDFHSGLNVITGETGSGKTIILSALSLIMGDRADSGYIRTGCDELTVCAVVSLGSDNRIKAVLKEFGIQPEDDRILIRRIVRANSKSVISVQGVNVTRTELCRISELLFVVHNQNEHQILLKPNTALTVLDGFSDNGSLLTECSDKFKRINELKNSINETMKLSEESEKQRDYLSYSLNEIKNADIKEDEDIYLTEKISVLSKSELIHETLSTVVQSLLKSLDCLFDSVSSLSKVQKYDESFSALYERLSGIRIDVDDILNELKYCLGRTDYSEQTVNAMQERLSLLQKLKRKYSGINGTLSDVIKFAESSEHALEVADNLDSTLDHLRSELKKAEDEYRICAKELSKIRQVNAELFSDKICSVLRPLGMSDAVFRINVFYSDDLLSAKGSDSVVFSISANPGEPLKPVSEVASGGELSRIMLALKTVHVSADNIQTQVFDEIDTGIGGQVGVKLAECLKDLSEKNQVILVTHLPTIAGKADYQFVVSKTVRDGRTFTHIRRVSGNERVRAIAGMMGGDNSDVSISHARQMLEESVR